jgi:hypothetical protein
MCELLRLWCPILGLNLYRCNFRIPCLTSIKRALNW